MTGTAKWVLLCWLALLAFAVPAAAQDYANPQVQAEIKSTMLRLELIQSIIDRDSTTDEQLTQQRQQLETLRETAGKEAAKLAGPVKNVQQQLSSLGPPPAEGATEAAAISTQRQQLTDTAANIAAAQKQYELIQLDADQTLQKLLAKQRSLFLERIFRADRTVLNPKLWLDYGTGMGLLYARVSSQLQNWLGGENPAFNPAALLLLVLGAAVVLVVRQFIIPWIKRRAGYSKSVFNQGDVEPSLLRLWRVVWGTFSYVLFAVLAVLLVLAAVASFDTVSPTVTKAVTGIVTALTSTGLYTWMTYLISAPARPERRLIAVDSKSARSLTITVGIATAAYAFGNALISLAETAYLPVGFVIGQSAVSVLVMVVFLTLALSVVRRQAAQDAGPERPYFLVWFMRLVPLFWLLLALSLVAIFLGYIALAYFITGNLLDTVMLAVTLGVAHAFLHGLAASAQDATSRVGQILRNTTGFAEDSIGRLVLTFRTFADILIVLIAIPSLMAMWTVTLVDFNTVITSAMRGFSIGSIDISPAVISLALGVLVAGIIVTRLITGWFQKRVLDETTLDQGVQVSLRTGAVYAGYTLAAALALSAAGLNFSTLAIVAGALGVGIGFGLQSIVNNFVSGLILLAERPIRVGDWIVTSGGEGIVKKINVRATEIETFDNATIIIPNLSLITNSVRNWTLRDSLGRFTVNVSFIHGVKAADVASKLESLAAAHPKVMRHPSPKAHLAKIAPNGLEFELGGQVSNVLEAADVASELRIAIAGAFDKKLLSLKPLGPAAK